MNDLETAITATLQANAREAAMSTDTTRESERLERRLDAIEHRRRSVWVGIVAAAAAAVIVGGVFVVAGKVSAPSPTPAAGGGGSESAPASTAPSRLVGTWETSFTKEQLRSVLETAGLGSAYGSVMQELRSTSDVLSWRMTFTAGDYRLELRRPDGSTEEYDSQNYDLAGRTLTANPRGLRIIFDVGLAAGDTSMTLRLLADDMAPLASGIPDKAMALALYTTGTWTKIT
jgi:hypothetical protein